MHHLEHHHETELDRHFGHVDHGPEGELDRRRQRHAAHHRREAAHSLAQGLGWLSIALGALDLGAPHVLARKMGMHGSERLIQAVGVREVVTGIGILAAKNPAPWLWARVAGDAFDLAVMATALHDGNHQRRNVALGMGMVGAIALLDILAAQRTSQAAKTRYLPTVDYSDRDGYPKGLQASRGAAADFRDSAFSTPEALRPWTDGKPQNGWSETGGGAKLASGESGAKLGETVERDTSVFGAAGGRSSSSSGQSGLAAASAAGQAGSGSAGGGLQQAAGSHERDDAFKTGSSFTGKGNEGP